MIRSIALVSALLITLAACKSGELRFDGNTPSGFPYVMHVDNDGTAPVIGDKISYSRVVRLGKDSILAPHSEMTVVLPEAGAVSEPAMAEYEILFLMSEGDSASVYITGEKSAAIPGFTATDTIIFDIAFRRIEMTKEDVMKEKEATALMEKDVDAELTQRLLDYAAGKLDAEIKTADMGLKYIIHEEGTGDLPANGANIRVHYFGKLMDGTTFDNSYSRGEPFEFPVGQGRVIQGWDMGLSMLRKGSKATFFIPAALGYGEMGSPPNIPANADLAFYVEVLDIR